MEAMRKNMRNYDLRSQRGAALVIAVIILLILTVVGIYAVTTSTIDTKITGYHKWHVEAFYAADAGIDYAVSECPFGTMFTLAPTPDTCSRNASKPEFDVTATYRGKTLPPVGSGVGQRTGFMAHHYEIGSDGAAQTVNAPSTIDAWGYRIGF